MGNTLFIYDNHLVSRHVAVMMSSIISMSRYMPYGKPAALQKYSQIIYVIQADPQHHTALTLPEEGKEKSVGIILIDVAEEQAPSVLAHIAEQWHISFTFSAVIRSSHYAEDAIAAAEQMLRRDTQHNQDPDVRKAIENFLNTHNTCVLATASSAGDNGISVRATPIEYLYENGKIYMFSEGGRKFINIYRNPNVSLAVFDPYSGFSKLAGLQLTGTCRVVEPDEEVYQHIAAVKGITKERIQAMPVVLHLLEITLHEAIFLWAGFQAAGKAVRQTYQF